ncbi:hypothetical protein [Bradyrhizobium sp. ARR65]|uniref:hypothetical protein n=1 Tax=Bradyrhizobium sp. ARR65 TaxID=1040989 RepID=UPI000A787197|nr:hypothetical protein [Bradyrhizobium sp. ARR65]
MGAEALSISIHNPNQYMASLRTIIAQGRKRIGLLVGAGAAAGTAKDDERPIPSSPPSRLTTQVLNTLAPKYGRQIAGLVLTDDDDAIAGFDVDLREVCKVAYFYA